MTGLEEPPEYDTPCGWCGHRYEEHYFEGCYGCFGGSRCPCAAFCGPVE